MFKWSHDLQPDLNGALFSCSLSEAKMTRKKAGVEGGKSCPNN